MGKSDTYLVLIAAVLYGVISIMYFFGLAFKRDSLLTWATRLGFVAVTMHLFGVWIRWSVSGHAPSNLYELNSLGGLLGVAFFLWTIRKRPELKILGAVIFPLVVLLIGYGFTKFSGIEPLKPEYQSLWLTLHILFAFTATACYVVSFSGSVIYLLRKQGLLAFYQQKLPREMVFQDLLARFNALGFVNHAMMILTGAIWAQQAWGRYWGWDPIETWSLITWLLYGLFLHLYFTLNKRGSWMIWLNAGAFLVVIASYWLVPHLPIKNFF